MSDARPPAPPPRRPAADAPAAPAPDPADLGTAYGLEMSIGAPDGSPDADGADARRDGTSEDDPLQWIRRWLERHEPR